MIKSVIFDWSGVISDEWNATVVTANEVLEEYGHPKISEDKFKELYELPWTRFYEKLGLDVDEEKEYKLWAKFMPKHYDLIKVFPQARKTLEWLKEKEIGRASCRERV